MSKIRLMLVDDSLFFRTFLTHKIGMEPSFEIVGSFGDPVEAVGRISSLNPDVLVVDMEMPKMRGNEFMRRVLPKHPKVKALVVSALSGNVFDAMQAGAIDFIAKPGSRSNFDETQFIKELVQKIKVAAIAESHIHKSTARPATATKTTRPQPMPPRITTIKKASSKNVIAIGASTGGTEAILEVIKDFPTNTPGIVIVQHMPPVFTNMYADRCNKACKMSVKEAQNGDRVTSGTVLIAPGGEQQMYLRQDDKGYYVYLTDAPKVSGHCPSVDVLFDSVAKTAGKSAIGIILTGMGSDGAKGLLSMKRTGAYTIGQDEESSVVYGMPMVAYNYGAVTKQLPLRSISDEVLRKFN